jgi:orotidine-5'-phosphate decarboxylase
MVLPNKPIKKLEHIINQNNSLVCLGLDSNFNKIPQRFLQQKNPQFKFNKWIIDQTHDLVSAYKPNLAFYEARGVAGWEDLTLTMNYLQDNFPGIFTIADAKRADIGSTNEGYATAIFDQLRFDAITLHPYLGQEALQPFLDREDKISIILCKTSNPGGGEMQNLLIDGKPLWQVVAEKVSQQWNIKQNCMLVVGATYPSELAQVRSIVGGMNILVPGIGAQGGDLTATLKAGLTSIGQGLLINSARDIIFNPDPRQAATELREVINAQRAHY